MDLILIFAGALGAGSGLVLVGSESHPILGGIFGWPLLVVGVVVCFIGLIKNHQSHTNN